MTEFKSAFLNKSPLGEHKSIQRKLKILRNNPEKAVKMGLSTEGQGGIDYDEISRLEGQLETAKKSHNKNRSEEDIKQSDEDEDAARGSAAEMNTPLEAGGYRGGGVGDYVSTADLYQNLFNKVEKGTREQIDMRQGSKKDEEFAVASAGMPTDSEEYKNLYVKTYGPIKPS